MSRKEVHSEDLPIEQRAPVVKPEDRQSRLETDVGALKKDALDEIAFMEEPVTIRLEPSSEKNAPTSIPLWVNGKGCEVFINGKWCELTYVPIGAIATIKRKYLQVLLGAKLDNVSTDHGEPNDPDPKNRVLRHTSSYQAFSIIEDANPKGRAWLSELRRRNL